MKMGEKLVNLSTTMITCIVQFCKQFRKSKNKDSSIFPRFLFIQPKKKRPLGENAKKTAFLCTFSCNV